MNNNKINPFKFINSLTEKEKVEMMYYSITSLFPLDMDEVEYEKWMETVLSEIRGMLNEELL